jgi:methylmalonyl-CoA mutase C-terminal domain/subunit
MQRKIRVLVGKPGLDGHDRGAKVVAAALRDAGMEVIYTGLHQTPEQVVEAAVHEDVDVVALSVLSGAHMTLFPEILELMRARGIGDRLLTGGGIIPNEDMSTLLTRGVGRLFGPGTNTHDIVAYIREWYAGVHGEGALPPLPPPPARPEPMGAHGARPTPAPARDAHHVRAAAKPAAKPGKPGTPAKRSAKPAKQRSVKSQARARRKPAPPKRSATGKPARKGGARKPGARR